MLPAPLPPTTVVVNVVAEDYECHRIKIPTAVAETIMIADCRPIDKIPPIPPSPSMVVDLNRFNVVTEDY